MTPGMWAAMSFGVCSAMHTATRAMPMQLAFGHDAILNVNHVMDWKCIHMHKQKLMRKNNVRENCECKECAHELNQLVLVKQDWTSKCGTTAHEGPCPMHKMNNDGAVQVQMNDTLDTHNAHATKPHNR